MALKIIAVGTHWDCRLDPLGLLLLQECTYNDVCWYVQQVLATIKKSIKVRLSISIWEYCIDIKV